MFRELQSFFELRPELFALDPEHFPSTTRSVFTVPEILSWGALPLGFKTKRGEKTLNVGFLNPSNRAIIEEVQRAVEKRFESQARTPIQIFRLDPGQFRDILIKVYQVSESELPVRMS